MKKSPSANAARAAAAHLFPPDTALLASLSPTSPAAEARHSIDRLTRDLKKAAGTLGREEARFLVDAYYTMQASRIRSENQCRALTTTGEPHGVLSWLFSQYDGLEREVGKALDSYSASSAVGQWARSQKGIGPVITAGLLAHIDITKAPTVGHIWSFAGLDPTKTWEKGCRRPWNAELKTLCWKIGESFVKVSGGENPGYYGVVYRERKALEEANNAAGKYAEQAAHSLATKKFGADTDARAMYEKGLLPKARIHERAKRYAVKLFLAHLHDVMYRDHFKEAPPLPYAIAHLAHAHVIPVPGAQTAAEGGA